MLFLAIKKLYANQIFKIKKNDNNASAGDLSKNANNNNIFVKRFVKVLTMLQKLI